MLLTSSCFSWLAASLIFRTVFGKSVFIFKSINYRPVVGVVEVGEVVRCAQFVLNRYHCTTGSICCSLQLFRCYYIRFLFTSTLQKTGECFETVIF